MVSYNGKVNTIGFLQVQFNIVDKRFGDISNVHFN